MLKEHISFNKIIIIVILALALVGTGVYFLFPKDNKIEIEKEEVVEPEFYPEKIDWQQVSDVFWSQRDSHTVMEFKGKLWLVGGIEVIGEFSNVYEMYPHKDDIWVSEDGSNWELALEHAPWGKRRSIGLVVFKDLLWAIGGWEEGIGTRNDVWYSEDGVNWKLAVYNAEFPKREGHTVFEFDDKIWITGGVDFLIRKTFNDVWYSEDGVNWELALEHAPWSVRYDHATVIFEDKIWLTGGVPTREISEDAKNDIWFSEDGFNWEEVLAKDPFPIRHGHIMLVYKDLMWIISGWNTTEEKGNDDVWYSEDGTNWQGLTTPWLGREDHGAVVFKDKMWVLGGMTISDNDSSWAWRNDIWFSINKE